MRAAWLFAFALVGCQETQHCDPGSSYQNGLCRPFGDAATVDATIRDASGGCVGDHDCVQQGTGSDAGLFVCIASHCVPGCTQDGDCASGHCTAMRVCSMYGRHQTTCQPCDSDEDCSQISGPSSCIDTHLQASDDGGHCLLRTSGTCMQPYATITLRTSVDGTMASFCVFDETTTTCAAVLSAIAQTHCTSAADCATRGASCHDVLGTGVGTQCTYDCAHNTDCPTGFGCAPQTFCHM
jgi:hypothetical protein